MSETKTIHSKPKTTFNKSYNMQGIEELFIDCSENASKKGKKQRFEDFIYRFRIKEK